MKQTTEYKKINNRNHRRAESKSDIRYHGISRIHICGTFGNRTGHRPHPMSGASEHPLKLHRRRFSEVESEKFHDMRSVSPIQTNFSAEGLSIEP